MSKSSKKKKKKARQGRRKMERAAARLSAPERMDVRAAAWAAQWRETPAVRAAAAIAELSDQPPLLTLCTAVYGAGLLLDDKKLRRCGESMFAAFGVATAGKWAGKQVVARTRPRAVARHGSYRRTALGPVEGDWNAFPSGHAAGAFAVAMAAGRAYPEIATPALSMAAAASLVQVLKGGHFPSDVIAGALLGVAAEAASAHGLGQLRRP